jgi:hypothetical protein
MPTLRILVPLCIAAAVASGAGAQQGLSARPPTVIMQEVQKLSARCREAGGAPGKSPGMMQIADLTGDGIVDYVLDLNTYNCDGATLSLEGGRKGAAILIFVGAADGGARKAFDSAAFGAKVRGAPRQRVWLDLQGEDCGQRDAASLSMAAQLACTRPLNWNPSTNGFDFAPLREARPYGPRPRGIAA